jgi:hypothetical protein
MKELNIFSPACGAANRKDFLREYFYDMTFAHYFWHYLPRVFSGHCRRTWASLAPPARIVLEPCYLTLRVRITSQSPLALYFSALVGHLRGLRKCGSGV